MQSRLYAARHEHTTQHISQGSVATVSATV